MIRRFVGKISGENPEEGIRIIIAKMLNTHPSLISLSDEDFAQIKEMDNQILKIKELINPFYDSLKNKNTKESNKKLLELIDLGKFLYFLNQDIRVVECEEQPDFIIECKSESIGVELTGIYDDTVVAEIKTIRKIFKKCEQTIAKRSSTLKGLFNVIIIPDKIREKLTTKREQLINSICECILAMANNKHIPKPDFIEDILWNQHSTLELTLWENYWLADLSTDTLLQTIMKKEEKITVYKATKNINKCWLLIVIDGASSISSFNINLDSLPNHLTAFDRIFIFDSFKGVIINGQVNP
ncbi:hypothetical protein [Ferruginibacter albus]|uniref:hypothetical protein n=1 Tax=Ferruginibacter albus TaxID=2875540 RepID=UPI001CC6C387|nr:hypothetical protein [Ferruginibacter albus]UAY52731.1 hypothetical protein K9M53_03325 [Ferruginibacter albus]